MKIYRNSDMKRASFFMPKITTELLLMPKKPVIMRCIGEESSVQIPPSAPRKPLDFVLNQVVFFCFMFLFASKSSKPKIAVVIGVTAENRMKPLLIR